jgi:hypothetical protein
MSDDDDTTGDDAAPEPGRARRPAHDGKGIARPAFLLDFPQDDDLERLIAAFEAGNYAYVRAHAEAVAHRTERPEVRDAALELRRRIEPDPLGRYLLVVSVALLTFLVIWAYVGHGH